MGKYYKYTTQQGDTFDIIALDWYKDERYSSTIIQANPEYAGVLVFDAGIVLKIPVVEKPKSSNLPPWKR